MIIWSKSGNTVIYIIESNPINLIYLHVIICLKSLLSLEASISRSLKKACRIYKRKKSWNHQPNIQFCIHPPQLHLPFQPNLPQHFTAGLPNPNCLIVAQVLKPYNEIITPSDHGNNQIHQTWKTEAAQELWTLNIFRRHRTLWLLSPLCISEVLDFGLFHGALRSIYGSKLDPFMNCVEGGSVTSWFLDHSRSQAGHFLAFRKYSSNIVKALMTWTGSIRPGIMVVSLWEVCDLAR